MKRNLIILVIALAIFVISIFYRIFTFPLSEVEDFIVFLITSIAGAISVFKLNFTKKI